MIPKINKILFATDLSKNARYAFNYAVSVASHYNVGLVLLHVMEDTPHGKNIVSHVGEDLWLEVNKRNEQDARNILIGKKKDSVILKEALDKLCEKAKGRLPESDFIIEVSIIRSENAAEGIIRQTEESGCDIIIMGYHS
ncbi:MAG: universal stress protein, partial [Deltaproteobacteria bacterium]|nr:universal stress protein [Deltaproteobacteria bacterium]